MHGRRKRQFHNNNYASILFYEHLYLYNELHSPYHPLKILPKLNPFQIYIFI